MAGPDRIAELVAEANQTTDFRRYLGALEELARSDDPRAFAPLFEALVGTARVPEVRITGFGPGASGPDYNPAQLANSKAWGGILEHGNEELAVWALRQIPDLPDEADALRVFDLACAIGGRTLFRAVFEALRNRELDEWQLSRLMQSMVGGLKRAEQRWTRDDREWARKELEALATDDPSRAIRTAAVFGLEYLRDPASVLTLLKATKDSEPMVRTTALEAVGKLPEEVVRANRR